MFTADSSGRGQGNIYKVDADGNRILADASSPAKSGDTLVVSCTGLSAVDPPVAAGSPAPMDSLTNALIPVNVTIGGKPAAVTFAGLAPGSAGLYQVIVTVPAGLPDSDATQIVLTAGGQESEPVIFAVRNTAE